MLFLIFCFDGMAGIGIPSLRSGYEGMVPVGLTM